MHIRYLLLYALLALGLAGSAQAQQVNLRCSSPGFRYQECRAPGPIRNAQLTQQLSSAACVFGRTWGVRHDSIWVDDGCSGNFRVDVGSGNWNQGGGWGSGGWGNSGGGWGSGGPGPQQPLPPPGWAVGSWTALNPAPGTVGAMTIFPSGAVTFGSNLGLMKGQWENGLIRTSDGRIWRIARGRGNQVTVTTPFGNRMEFRRAG